MTATTQTRSYERDWKVLKGVVCALWVSAAVVIVAVQYFMPRDRDIVVTSSPVTAPVPSAAVAASPAILQLAGQGPR